MVKFPQNVELQMKRVKSHNLNDFYKNLIAIGKEKQKIKLSMRKGSEKTFQQ